MAMEILKTLKGKIRRKSWLGHLTKNGLYAQLCLLLESENFDYKAVRCGFQTALFYMRPKCLDTIAKYAAKRGVTFSLTGPYRPYHFLFTGCKRYPGNNIVECTKVLINNGFNIEEHANVTGFYPLYTLIQHARETFPASIVTSNRCLFYID